MQKELTRPYQWFLHALVHLHTNLCTIWKINNHLTSEMKTLNTMIFTCVHFFQFNKITRYTMRSTNAMQSGERITNPEPSVITPEMSHAHRNHYIQ